MDIPFEELIQLARVHNQVWPADLVDDLKEEEPSIYQQASIYRELISKRLLEQERSRHEPTLVVSGWDHIEKKGQKNWADFENLLFFYALGKLQLNLDYETALQKETDLEEDFVRIFKGDKLPLVQFSPQNIDRLVTVYRACKRTGKTLVIDAYTAFVLEVYSQLSNSIPQFNWENIMVNFARSSINDKLAEDNTLYRYKNKKIRIEKIVSNPEKYVIKGNGSINKQIFDAMDHDKLEIVFSMWKGYLDRPNQFDEYKDIKLTPLHTSGHAYIEDLQKLVDTMQPKNLIPIHTEYKDKFKELFNANIIELNDGQEINL